MDIQLMFGWRPSGIPSGRQQMPININGLRPVFEPMERTGMPLLIHGEVADAAVDIFDREADFLERTLLPLLRDFQG
jgi:dihydroorotase